MTFIRPSTLTQDDVLALDAQYGQDYNAIVTDLEAGIIPEGLTLEDMVARVAETIGLDALNPNNPALSYLWEDTEVQNTLLEMWNDNQSDEDIVADLEAMLALAGVALDPVNLGFDYLNQYADILATEVGLNIEELYDEIKNSSAGLNLPLFLLLILTGFKDQTMKEFTDTFSEKLQEVLEAKAEKIEEIDSISTVDNPDANGDLTTAQNELQALNELAKTLQEILELSFDDHENFASLTSETASKQNRTVESIISNMA